MTASLRDNEAREYQVERRTSVVEKGKSKEKSREQEDILLEMNIQRVVRDGLDIEKNLLEHVELTKTVPLEKFSSPSLRKILQTFYQGEGGLPYLACLLNAVLCQEKVTFFLDYRVMSRLIKNDHLLPSKDMTPFLFKTMLEKVTRGGFIKQIAGDEGPLIHVYTLIHPDLLKYFYRTMGKEAIAEQRSYVLQYVKGVKELESDESPGTLSPPPLPDSLESEDKSLQQTLELEKAKLNSLKERARMAETYRLNNGEDQEACRQAVQYATEFKKHEKWVMDLELQYLRSQEGNTFTER